MGFEGPSKCSLAKNKFENMEHILFKCPFGQNYLYWVKNKLNWTTPLPQDIEGFLRGWPIKNRVREYEKL